MVVVKFWIDKFEENFGLSVIVDGVRVFLIDFCIGVYGGKVFFLVMYILNLLEVLKILKNCNNSMVLEDDDENVL